MARSRAVPAAAGRPRRGRRGHRRRRAGVPAEPDPAVLDGVTPAAVAPDAGGRCADRPAGRRRPDRRPGAAVACRRRPGHPGAAGPGGRAAPGGRRARRSTRPAPGPRTRGSACAGCCGRSGWPFVARHRAGRRWTPCCSWLLPALVRTGIDHGRRPAPVRRCCSPSPRSRWSSCWSTGRSPAAGQRLTGRTGERLLYTLRVKIFAQLQRLGPGLLRARAGRPDHDPDDHRRRRAVELPADRPATALVSVLTLVGVLVALVLFDVQLALVLVATLPVLVVATVVFRRLVGAGLRRGPGAGQRGQRPAPGGRRRGAGRPGVQPRAGTTPATSWASNTELMS